MYITCIMIRVHIPTSVWKCLEYGLCYDIAKILKNCTMYAYVLDDMYTKTKSTLSNEPFSHPPKQP